MEESTITRKDYGRKYRLYPNKNQEEILLKWMNQARSYTNELIWNQTKSDRYIRDRRNPIIIQKIKEFKDAGKTEEEIELLKTPDFWNNIKTEMHQKYPVLKTQDKVYRKQCIDELSAKGIEKTELYKELENLFMSDFSDYDEFANAPLQKLSQSGVRGMYKIGTSKYNLPSAIVLGILSSNEKGWSTYFDILKNSPSVAHLIAAKKRKKEKGKSVENFGKPKFQKKWETPSLLFTGTPIKSPSFDDQVVYIQKMKTPIKARIDHPPIGKVTSVCISRIGNKWFISYNFSTNFEVPVHSKADVSVGLDLGVNKFLVTCDENEKSLIFEFTEKFKKRLENLKKRKNSIQKTISRIERAELKNGVANDWDNRIKDYTDPNYKVVLKHSKNWFQNNNILVETNYKINEILNNYRHFVTNVVTKKYGTIGIDNLQVDNMTKSAKGTESKPGKNVKQKSGLNREILEKGWGIVNNQIKYKSGWKGGSYIEIDPAFTSQTCPACLHVSKENRKTQESFKCVSCGFEHNADYVGAKNNLAKLVGEIARLSKKKLAMSVSL